MAERAPETPVEAALARLAALHREAASLRATAAAAERALAAGLRLASRIRRRARGSGPRPGAEDAAALEEIADALERALERALAAPEVAGLAEAVARGRAERAAELAPEVFQGLARLRAAPDAALLSPLPFRRTRPQAGEALPAPEEAAALVRERLRQGLGPPPPRLAGLTEPIVLSLPSPARPSLALRLRAGDVAAPLLLHGPSGDVWVFASRLAGPFSVSIGRAADDEWWAASPVSLEDYADQLEAALARDGIRVVRE